MFRFMIGISLKYIGKGAHCYQRRACFGSSAPCTPLSATPPLTLAYSLSLSKIKKKHYKNKMHWNVYTFH